MTYSYQAPEVLDISLLDDIYCIERKTFDALPEDQKSFVVPKTKKDLAKYCNSDGGVIFGIKHKETYQLVAISSLTMPSQDNPATGLEAYSAPFPEKSSILTGVKVLPEHRGHGLMRQLILAREMFAKSVKRTQLYSEVAAENVYSWRNLLKHDFSIIAMKEVVEYGRKVPLYYLRKNLLDHYHENKELCCVNRTDFETQKKLFAQNAVGRIIDKDERIIFTKAHNVVEMA